MANASPKRIRAWLEQGLADDLARTLGNLCYEIDSGEGLLGMAAMQAWDRPFITSDAELPLGYDPEIAAAMLRDAGFAQGPDGRWNVPDLDMPE